jgi:uncharacterized protein (DUF433 family)
MSTRTTPARHPKLNFSLRVASEILEALEERAHRSASNRTALAERYLEEGMRMDTHIGVVFRDGPAGRRPGIAGSGVDVWEVVRILQDGASREDAAEGCGLRLDQVQAAISYYADYKKDIDTWISFVDEEANALQAALERQKAVFA